MATKSTDGYVGAHRGECEGGIRKSILRNFESELLRPARLAPLQATTCRLVRLASFRSESQSDILFCV